MRRPSELLISAPTDSVDHEDCNDSPNPSFNEVLDVRLSRRHVLRGGVGSAASMLLGGLSLAACGGGGDDDTPVAAAPTPAPAPTPVASTGPVQALSFVPVAKSLADTVSVPLGYTARPVYALGDPLTAATPAFRNDGTDTDYDNRAGDHHDGMEYFGLSADGSRRDPLGSQRGVLAMNHEALTDNFLHPAGASARPRPVAEADKEIPAHGLSVVEVRQTAGRWATVQDSAYNRRVTPLTPVRLAGVARGNALLVTKYAPDGLTGRGTINNCGTGVTPWGTFLTGEENWAGYFTRRSTDNAARTGALAKSVASLARYGRTAGSASRHGWETAGPDDRYARWDLSVTGASSDGSDDYRHELNTFGYIVEMDAYDKNALVTKRTSLGRFAHESASFGPAVAGQPLAVYMGDDSRGEYIYKFVSAAPWSAADANPADRVATGDKYLDAGTLFVAVYNADGTGTWVALTLSNPLIQNYAGYAFADEGDVVINARLAADAVGATKMDRPEWCAVHPLTGEIYYTLTNNSNRKLEPVTGQQGLDPANPRAYSDVFGNAAPTAPGNLNGHIIRMKETGGRGAATSFTWDVYLFGAQADANPALVNLSGLTADQDFSSPDGLWFSASTGLCWIQTDDGAYTDATNCMMLVGVPGQVGDGVKTTLSYTQTNGTPVTVDTYVGKKPTLSTLRRFLVGPVDCELTGCTETPDGKTLFANIQHPGETITAANVADPSKYLSHWPANAGYGAGGALGRPRSATVAITKDDGGRIGT
ncbi:MAG: PhoX family phosphatase [Pseudomonadota bacterium]